MSRNIQSNKVKCVVPLSGGKDSQSCLKLAIEKFGRQSVVGMFCDTKFEHPETYLHVKRLSIMYGVKVEVLNAGSVKDKIRKYGRFPSGCARFCTDELKIQPGKKFYKLLAENQNSGFEVWYGIRSEESSEREKRYKGKVSDELYAPHEFMPGKYPKYLHKLGVRIRLPIINWTESDVYEFLNGEENPLYKQGFGRVGCFPCLASGDKWKEKAFNFDEHGIKTYEIVKKLEKEIGKSIWTSKSGKFRNDGIQGCLICSI